MGVLIYMLNGINFFVGYIVPFFGTLYSIQCNEKWIFSWIMALILNFTLNPLLNILMMLQISISLQIFLNCFLSIAFTQQHALIICKKMREWQKLWAQKKNKINQIPQKLNKQPITLTPQREVMSRNKSYNLLFQQSKIQ